MRMITVDDIMDLRPCEEYSRERVAELWGDADALTLTQICDLDIPTMDRIWAMCQLLPDREARLFACDCAARALSLVDNPDFRSMEAVTVARRYSNGEATEAELVSAEAGAWTAAVEAAWKTARDAAVAAAWAATTAGAVAVAAAWEAAMKTEREHQVSDLRGYCSAVDAENSSNRRR